MRLLLAVAALSGSFAVPAAARGTHESALIKPETSVIVQNIALEKRVAQARRAESGVREVIQPMAAPPGRGNGHSYRLAGDPYVFRREQYRFFTALRGAVHVGGRQDARVREMALWGLHTRVLIGGSFERVISEKQYRVSLGL